MKSAVLALQEHRIIITDSDYIRHARGPRTTSANRLNRAARRHWWYVFGAPAACCSQRHDASIRRAQHQQIVYGHFPLSP